MAAQIAVCLAERMVLARIVSAVGGMDVEKAERGAGLMAENWVQ